MAKIKSNLKKAVKQPHPHHVPLTMALMIAIVFILTASLLFIWNLFPHELAYVPPQNASSTIPSVPTPPITPPATTTPPVVVTPSAPDCGTHGHWNGTACLCGGIAGWSCPSTQVCGDMKPSPTTPDAMGTCRAKAVAVREKPEGMICDELNAVCVSTSLANTVLGNPWYVTGTVSHGVVGLEWELFDGNGISLGREGRGPGADENGVFRLTNFQSVMPASTTGTLRLSAGFPGSIGQNGYSWTALNIPIRFAKDRMKVTFFSRAVIGDSCTALDATVYEIPKSSKSIAAALNVLLWQATENVSQVGPPGTQIPEGTKLNSAVLNNSILKLEFSKELENYGGGSCNVESIRTQIEKTAKQFGNVTKVEISVPGKTAAETLQP
ncbi:MAG: GerMN domain-containing protein [Candidatus Uhrbacteria bacterium]